MRSAAEPKRASSTACSASLREPPTRLGLHATRPNFCNGTGASVAGQTTPPSPPPASEQTPRTYRTAQTRAETRQVSGHFRPDVAQTLCLIAAEQSRDIQEILAEALNMVFARYGKATRAEVSSGRRKKVTT